MLYLLCKLSWSALRFEDTVSLHPPLSGSTAASYFPYMVKLPRIPTCRAPFQAVKLHIAPSRSENWIAPSIERHAGSISDFLCSWFRQHSIECSSYTHRFRRNRPKTRPGSSRTRFLAKMDPDQCCRDIIFSDSADSPIAMGSTL